MTQPTAASAVPRAGNASFGIDVFGLSSMPGFDARDPGGNGTTAIAGVAVGKRQ